jgi:hypothetical protein
MLRRLMARICRQTRGREGATRRNEKAIAVIKPKVNPSCERGRTMRFIRPRTLVLAALAICMISAGTPSHARSLFWPQFRWWDDHQFRHKHQHNRTKSDLTKKPQLQDAPKGPLHIIISIADQRISVRKRRTDCVPGIDRRSGSSNTSRRLQVLSKEKWHRSNIYSAAPMPYMQRITWSGIALHAGDLPGYPASHGCIRLTNDFAVRLWHLTKRGTRVIIAHDDIRPVEASNPHLFQPKPEVASGLAGSGTARLAGNDIVASSATYGQSMSNTETQKSVQLPAPASAEAKPKRLYQSQCL